MKKMPLKTKMILGILFFLPVLFVLVLTLSKENYNSLDIVNENVNDIPQNDSTSIQLKDHLTVLAFLGKKPNDKSVAALNLKEIVYDRFKGFKKFQVVVLVSEETKLESAALFKEIAKYEDMRFWHFVYLKENEIKYVFNGLKTNTVLNQNLATDHVFIIDTDLNQRGRIDDRTDNEKKMNKPIYGLYDYDCIKVAELKNKMSADDLRILFTEYRQKRKGKFDSSSRRKEDIEVNN